MVDTIEWACVLCGCCIQNDWARQSNKSASNFVLSLNIPPWKLFGWFRRLQLWATGDWQLLHNAPSHASRLMQSFFGETSNLPGDSASLQPRFGALWLLAFPKTKITIEREEISDSWDSGKQDVAADGEWENCVRSPGVYFEGDWSVIVLYVQCFLYLVSSSINISFSYYRDEYFLDRPCMSI